MDQRRVKGQINTPALFRAQRQSNRPAGFRAQLKACQNQRLVAERQVFTRILVGRVEIRIADRLLVFELEQLAASVRIGLRLDLRLRGQRLAEVWPQSLDEAAGKPEAKLFIAVRGHAHEQSVFAGNKSNLNLRDFRHDR